MESLLRRICINCEHSYILRTGGCVCFKKDRIIVREDSCCKNFVPDLMKYVPGTKKLNQLDMLEAAELRNIGLEI